MTDQLDNFNWEELETPVVPASNDTLKIQKVDSITFRMLAPPMKVFKIMHNLGTDVAPNWRVKDYPKTPTAEEIAAFENEHGATIDKQKEIIESWLMPIYDRTDKSVKVLEIGWSWTRKSIFEDIKNIAIKNGKQGVGLSKYDLEITKEGSGKSTKFKVSNSMPSALTEEEQTKTGVLVWEPANYFTDERNYFSLSGDLPF